MKNQPSEEENTQYEFRCHQCGEVFMDDIFGYEYPLTPLMLAKPKKCPYCGSVRIMPAGSLDEDYYERIWELMEKKAEKEEEKRLRSEAKRRTKEENG